MSTESVRKAVAAAAVLVRRHVPGSQRRQVRRPDGERDHLLAGVGERQRAIVVTFDEGNFATDKIATIVIANHGQRGVTDNTSYNHYSLLASLQDTFGLPFATLVAEGSPSGLSLASSPSNGPEETICSPQPRQQTAPLGQRAGTSTPPAAITRRSPKAGAMPLAQRSFNLGLASGA